MIATASSTRAGAGREASDAGQHGIADRGRQPLGPGRERLGDKERIAGGAAEQLNGVHAGGTGEMRDRPGRETFKLKPTGPGRSGQLAEENPQRMGVAHLLIAIAEHQQHQRHGPAAAATQDDHVECRLIGPVHIFDHQHRRRRVRRLLKDRRGDLVRTRATGDRLG